MLKLLHIIILASEQYAERIWVVGGIGIGGILVSIFCKFKTLEFIIFSSLLYKNIKIKILIMILTKIDNSKEPYTKYITP